jgi:hypothetical protein
MRHSLFFLALDKAPTPVKVSLRHDNCDFQQHPSSGRCAAEEAGAVGQLSACFVGRSLLWEETSCPLRRLFGLRMCCRCGAG